MAKHLSSMVRLVNGSTGDPVLFVDYPGKNDGLLFDAGENCRLEESRLRDLEAVFITHHHIDHFIGLDRILRANLDSPKVLHFFGPLGTIQKIYNRLSSYEMTYFPFQQIVLDVTELGEGIRRRAKLECSRKFAFPEIEDQEWTDRVVHDNGDVSIEAVLVDHTVPCLAYALVERSGYHPDPASVAQGTLKPGPWVGEVSKLLARKQTEGKLDIQGGSYSIAELVKRYFKRSAGARIAYITDTAWSEKSKPKLLSLAKGATILFCDSFYSERDAKSAAKHRHMTARRAGELAAQAKVQDLVLIHFSKRYAGRYETLLVEAREAYPQARAEIEP